LANYPLQQKKLLGVETHTLRILQEVVKREKRAGGVPPPLRGDQTPLCGESKSEPVQDWRERETGGIRICHPRGSTTSSEPREKKLSKGENWGALGNQVVYGGKASETRTWKKIYFLEKGRDPPACTRT